MPDKSWEIITHSQQPTNSSRKSSFEIGNHNDKSCTYDGPVLKSCNWIIPGLEMELGSSFTLYPKNNPGSRRLGVWDIKKVHGNLGRIGTLVGSVAIWLYSRLNAEVIYQWLCRLPLLVNTFTPFCNSLVHVNNLAPNSFPFPDFFYNIFCPPS